MRKIYALLVTVVLVLTSSLGVSAALPETVMPLWDNITSMPVSITFNGTSGSADASIVGKSGVTLISGTLMVYEKTSTGWRYVGSDSDTVEARSMALNISFTGTANVEYKAEFSVSVVRNGVVETESKTVYQTC